MGIDTSPYENGVSPLIPVSIWGSKWNGYPFLYGDPHRNVCLIIKHGQIHPEFLDIDHELAERRPICQVARGSP